ncbi:MAG: CRR6 family NdhI maturation factor [Cyanobium sp.]
MAPSSSTPSGSLLIRAAAIRQLDISALDGLAALPLPELLERSGSLSLALDWPRPPEDPRELSEITEVRLWSLRADALLPWLPLLLERSGGQLTRHVAMLLPHGFSRSEGIRFAAESLELWITHRMFLLDHLARRQGISCRGSLSQMAAVLGFELDAGFWEALPPS